MAIRDTDLDRLFRAAAAADDEPVESAPFGFDTRVVAQWRSQPTNGSVREVMRLLRRIAVGAAIVITFASAGAYWQFSENEEDAEPLMNAYAIADNAIDSGLSQ